MLSGPVAFAVSSVLSRFSILPGKDQPIRLLPIKVSAGVVHIPHTQEMAVAIGSLTSQPQDLTAIAAQDSDLDTDTFSCSVNDLPRTKHQERH